jgi:hypothetical protein
MSYSELSYKNELSYKSVLDNIKQFRSSGSRNGNEFNIFDTTTQQFFKILFHFYNDDVDNKGATQSGLLGPTWMFAGGWEKDYNAPNNNILYNQNTAWSYLMLNGEYERAKNLERFVELLSNINTYSPWYFNSIEGLDVALERKQIGDKNFIFSDERKKISIKCLPDAYDERIGTLLDLYKSVVWSWQMKREVVPSNLRKFDMSIYIFPSPISNIVKSIENNNIVDAEFNDITNGFKTSYKYIEFHNCEIDYNSFKSAYGSLSNEAGVEPTYTIDIYFDDCYENRYNEFIAGDVGDLIAWDTTCMILNGLQSSLSYSLNDSLSYLKDIDNKKDKAFNEFNNRFNRYDNAYEAGVSDKIYKLGEIRSNRAKLYDEDKNSAENLRVEEITRTKRGMISNAINEVVGGVTTFAKSKVKRLVLGNLYGFSLTRLGSQVSNLLQGKVGSTIYAVNSYIKKDSLNSGEPSGNIYKVDQPPISIRKVENLGNIYSKKSIQNNI